MVAVCGSHLHVSCGVLELVNFVAWCCAAFPVGLAMALSLGADAVWVGTRFICSEEVRIARVHARFIGRGAP